MDESHNYAISLITENQVGILRDIGSVCAEHNANIVLTQQETVSRGPDSGYAWVDLEITACGRIQDLVEALQQIPGVRDVKLQDTFRTIFGKRVIIMGGGAQVAQVAMGAVNEADRHNIRGERISVDTIPLVGEENLASAVSAVARPPRATRSGRRHSGYLSEDGRQCLSRSGSDSHRSDSGRCYGSNAHQLHRGL